MSIAPLAQPLCVLGSQASGKSCFLAGLALLGDASTESDVQVLGAAGTETQYWLSEMKTSLRDGRWPPATMDTRLFVFDIITNGELFRAAMVDYPGESFLNAMNTLEPDQLEIARNHIHSCKMLLLLLDPEIELDAATPEHPEAVEHKSRRLDALLNAVFDQIRNQADPNVDIAFIVSKADRLQTDYSPKCAQALVKKRLPAIYKKVACLSPSAKNEVQCFFISAVGGITADADGRTRPVRPPAQKGYEVLLRWIVERKRVREASVARRAWWNEHKFWFTPAAIMMVTLLLFGILGYWHEWYWRGIAINEDKPLPEREAALEKIFWNSVDATPSVNRTRLEVLNNSIAQAGRSEDLNALRKELARIKDAPGQSPNDQSILDAEAKLHQKEEEILYNKVADAHKAAIWTEVLESGTTYLKTLPTGRRRDAVSSMQVEANQQISRRDRVAVGKIILPSHYGDWHEFLRRKADAVIQYAMKHTRDQPPLQEDLLAAAEKARSLATNRQYNATIQSALAFNKNVYTSNVKVTRITTDGGESDVHSTRAVEAGRQPVWGETCAIPWSPGDRYRIEWCDDRTILKFWRWSGDRTIARTEDVNPELFALRQFSGPTILRHIGEGWGDYLENGRAELRVQLDGFTREDWALLERYIHPGGFWNQ